jgi:hypothetical protein
MSTLNALDIGTEDYLDLHPKGPKTRFRRIPCARIFCLVEEVENRNMMLTNKVIQLFCRLPRCGSDLSPDHYTVHQNHGLNACAGTQIQHRSCR